MKEFGEGSRSIGIFELSELFGITPEALRKYEEKHILHPIRDKNGYRKYSSWDLTKLVRIRQLRSEGVSLGSVAQQLRQGDPHQKLQELESLKQALAEEIVQRNRLIAWMDAQQRDLLQAQHLGDSCTVERCGQQYCCVYMVNDTLVAKNGAALAHLKEWVRALPFLHVIYVDGAKGLVLTCLSCGEDERAQYGLQHLTPDFILPARLCAVCNLPVDHSPEGDSLSESFYSIAQARQKAESLGLPLSGQFVLQMLWYTQENGIFRTYNKALFPILSEK